MAKIIDVKKSVVVELKDKEGWALFQLIEKLCDKAMAEHTISQYGLETYTKHLQDLRAELRPYYDELPF